MDISTKYISGTDLVARYGVGLRSLSDYEKLGLLRPAAVVGSERYYAAKDCTRLELILKGRRLGFSLAEIAKLVNHAHDLTGRLQSQVD